MPSKTDFQSLVDWCTQKSMNPFVKNTVGVYLVWNPADPEEPSRVWEGNLTYFPPLASRWFPEHFEGVLSEQTGSGKPINLAFAIGDKYAGVGLGAYQEFDVDSVDDEGSGVLEAIFGNKYTCSLFPSVSFAF